MDDAPESLPEETHFGRSVLTVGDESALVEFYRDVVGLAVLRHRDARTDLGVGETTLLELHHDPEARKRPADAAGLFHNAFRVPDRAALGDALGRIRDRWTLDGASDHGVSEALYCTDPEGNGVEIYCDRPREDWPRDPDGSPKIGSWPLDLEAVEAAASSASPEDANGASPEDANGAPPEDADSEAVAPSGTDLGHVHFEVSSIDAAREFYADALGFGVVETLPSALFLAAGGYHHHVGVNTWNGRSEPVPDDARGLRRVELVVPSTDALGAIRARCEDADGSVTERGDGLEITDPDGIRIRVRVDEQT